MIMKKQSVYTKGGDHGMTSLVGGKRISKCDIRIEAYGTVDELNSYLGLLYTYLTDKDDANYIERIQNDLFVVCSYLATDQSTTELNPACVLDKLEVSFVNLISLSSLMYVSYNLCASLKSPSA